MLSLPSWKVYNTSEMKTRVQNNWWLRIWAHLEAEVSIAPLATFRIVFGALMVFSVLRFWYLGWIEDHFINTQFTFKYFGFEWVQLLSPAAMYYLHFLMLLGAVGIMLGWFYRLSAILFFLTFTYVELIDLTYYLNHYYFVTLISFLLIWVPANRYFSLDVYRNPNLAKATTPRWTIAVFQAQIAIVYIYAGLAKINADWLLHALPLKIWLPAHSHLPVVGEVFSWEITAYVFSWVGMLYDLFIVFFLIWKPTRVLAYISVVIFHVLTGFLFQIGIFPLVMIGGTWIFFPEKFHQRLLAYIGKWFRKANKVSNPLEAGVFTISPNVISWLLGVYFLIQVLFPWRYLLYPGNLFWTEEGYRFSWRVMLVEKAGEATFFVKDTESGREGRVDNSRFLRPQQERLMAYQPDMILQYAHFLAEHFRKENQPMPEVRAEVFVTLNGRPSQLLVDPNINLATVQNSWTTKDWIIRE